VVCAEGVASSRLKAAIAAVSVGVFICNCL
jgi:hypothetical protein